MLARAAALILLIIAGGGWAWHISSLERRMVMADPDVLPADVSAYAVRAGAKIFARHCQACHGVNGKDGRVTGVPALTDGDWLYGAGTVSDIELTISYGIRASNGRSRNLAIMPAYATARPSPTEAIPPLTPADIHDVGEYLMKIEGRPADEQASGRGAAVYLDRGGCYDCHGADAKGDPAIGAPDLTDAIWLTGDGSREALFNTIARGAAGMCPAWTGVLDAGEIRAAAAYVRSLSHPSSPR